MSRHGSGMRPLRQVYPAVLEQLIRRQPLTPAKVTFAWGLVVGPVLARATEATLSRDGGILTVRVETEAWRRELARSLPAIRARLDALLGDHAVTDVRLALQPARPGSAPGRRSSPS